MAAATLNCLMCGAPVKGGESKCGHCGARVATVACPSCFGLVFEGAKFCQHCGALVTRPHGKSTALPCPGCQTKLEEITLGHSQVDHCPKCDGLWVDNRRFEQICADREQQSVILGAAGEVPKAQLSTEFRYVRCPVCNSLMHRVNFANCSGVVIDICKPHGTWFERHELQNIIAFIRAGGMDKARDRKKREMESAARRLENARQAEAMEARKYYGDPSYSTQSDLFDAVASAVWHLLR